MIATGVKWNLSCFEVYNGFDEIGGRYCLRCLLIRVLSKLASSKLTFFTSLQAMGALRATGGEYPERIGEPFCQVYDCILFWVLPDE